MLKAIKEGKASPEILSPGKVYIFVTDDRNPDQYRMWGKVYNRDEYLQFCEEVNHRHNGSIIFDEVKQYQPHKIITVQVVRTGERIKI